MLRRALRTIGYDLVPFDPLSNHLARRMCLLHTHEISVVLDVGANIGQYAKQLRGLGYEGKIVSFEPVSSTFAALASSAAKDPLWQPVQCAFGDKEEETVIHISGHSQANSLLNMLPHLESTLPGSAYTGSESITVKRLDTVFSDYCADHDSVFLKLDVQGYERQVLRGSEQCLSRIAGIQLEAAICALYEGEPLLSEMIDYVCSMGYSLHSIEPGFGDAKSGRLLQCDCIFFRD